MTLLITGASGQLGSVLWRQQQRRGEASIGVISPSATLPSWGPCLRAELRHPEELAALCRRVRPTHVIHAAAIANVALAHSDPTLATTVNVEASAALARAAREVGARLVYVSTDMVFDGERAPYDESARPEPGSVYGRTKREGELATLAECDALVVRLPLLYGFPALPRHTTFAAQVRAVRDRQALNLYEDEFRTPLWLEDAASALHSCAHSELTGFLHLGGPERLSRLEMGASLAEALGQKGARLVACSRNATPADEPRPRDLSLSARRYREAFGADPGRTLRAALHEMQARGELTSVSPA